MKCPNCDYDNREGARFCHQCGVELLMAQSTVPLDVSQHSTQPLTAPPAPDLSPERGGGSATRPLAGVSAAFAPLPEGALLRDGQYEIVETRATDDQSNFYLVEDTTPVRICPNCEVETSDAQERFCAFCGADVSDVAPLHLRYLMRESADEHTFATEAQLLGMRLEHPGLLLPREVFAEAPYGPPRHYLVEAEFSPPLATSLAAPQELSQVLEWGIQLAQALDYLHRHQVTLREVGLNQITANKKQARWTHLSAATVLPPESRSEAASLFSQDVKGLTAALFYLATGERDASRVQMPEPAAMAFSHALISPTSISAAEFATALEEALEELRRPASVNLVVGSRTDVGQERSLNEDSLLTLDTTSVFRSASTPIGLFAVADGMGGHAAGDVASRLAIQTIAQQATGEILPLAAAGGQLPDAHQWLNAATAAANQAVYEQRRGDSTDMGTTLVMALIVGDKATIANVGDSRAYLLNEDDIVQITTDHSLVERLVATGQITREEAASHPQKNVIYRVVGDKPRTEPDLFDQRLRTGEALLLCSDGLSGMVTDEQMWHIWRTSTSPQEACERLVEAANRAGGEDNASVVIVQLA
jgi:serine/threonine protein phosphatase PrpC